MFKFRNIIILPMILGFAAAGVLAGVLGMYDWAAAALCAGFASTVLIAAYAAITALALALAVLSKAVAALWTVVSAVWGDLDGGPGGDDNELEPDEDEPPKVVYDVTAIVDPPRTSLFGERAGSN